MAEQDRVCIGVISGVRGVRGDVRIKAFTEHPENLSAYGALQFEDGTVVDLVVKSLVKGEVVAGITGVDDRTAAEALRGAKLYLDGAALPAPEEDEFYYHQLIGLAVLNETGQRIGEVIAVQDYGAGDLIDVKLTGRRSSVLIPFTQNCVPVVNVKDGFLRVTPPPGLLDDEKAPDDGADG